MGKGRDRQKSKNAQPRPWPRAFAWALDLVARGRGTVTPRIALATREGVDPIEMGSFGLGSTGLEQAAAVFARSVADDALVAILMPAYRLDRDKPVPTTLLVARSRAGARYGTALWLAPLGGGRFNRMNMDLAAEDLDAQANWFDPAFRVDPEIERLLAARGFPNARAASEPTTPALDDSGSGATSDEATDEPQTSAEDATSELTVALVEPPWQAARERFEELTRLDLTGVGIIPYCELQASAPPGLQTRPIADLLASAWSNETQACVLTGRLDTDPELPSALRAFLSAPLPAVSQLLACARAARTADVRGDHATRSWAAHELVTRLDAAIETAGGIGPWLDAAWPRSEAPGSETGTAAIAVTAVAAYWSIFEGIQTAKYPLADHAPLARAIERAAHFRDALLDRAGVAAADPGDRVAAIGARVLGGDTPAAGESRVSRWMALHRPRVRSPAEKLLNKGAWHAAVLHSLVTIANCAVAYFDALLGGAPRDFHPAAISTRGLLRHALIYVANRHVLRAFYAEDDHERLRLLGRAREIAPFSSLVASCFAEARFRAGRRDAALLADLLKEGGVAAWAEAVQVAEAIGARREGRIATARLGEAAKTGPHHWIVAVRALFGRPGDLARLDLVKRLEDEPDPVDVDLGDRASFALYGPDAATTVAAFRRALASQREALEWAALVQEVRAEELASPSGEGLARPEAPTRASEGAVDRAMAAVRWRLDRPNVERASFRRAALRHLRRAAELFQRDEAAAPWILAVAEPTHGLVRALDHALAGDDAAVEGALAAAEAALDEAIRASWLGAFFERLATIWSQAARAGSGGDEIVKGAHALHRDAGAAAEADAAARAQVDAALTNLLVSAARAGASEDEAYDDDGADTEESVGEAAEPSFHAMRLPERAIDRSRRDLATPEWAMQEGVRQVAYYNAARGRRDLKMLRGTRDEESGAIWELRHRDGRHPVRVFYRHDPDGPCVLAIVAKEDDAQQRRVLDRIRNWS